MTSLSEVQAAQALNEIASLASQISGLLMGIAFSTPQTEADDLIEKQGALGQAFRESAKCFRMDISGQERLRHVREILRCPTVEYTKVVRRDHPPSPVLSLMERMSTLVS